MKDVAAWQLLGQEPLDAEVAARLLGEAASERTALRGALAERAQSALRHEDPHVRSAVVRCFGGLTGPRAWAALVSALDDRDPTVRLAAARALKLSTARDHWRQVHLLFHRDPAVREVGIRGLHGALTPDLWWLLLVDPVHGDLARELLRSPQVTSARGIKALLTWAEAGRLPADEVAGWIPRFPWRNDLAAILAALPGPARQDVDLDLHRDDALAALAACAAAEPLVTDPLQRLFAIVLACDDDQAGPRDQVFSDLLDALERRGEDDAVARQAAISLLRAIVRSGGGCPTAVAACTWVLPRVMAMASIPEETRRGALRILSEYPPRRFPAAVGDLLGSRLVDDGSGPDLGVVRGILGLGHGSPWLDLRLHFTAGQLAAAAPADPRGAARLLALAATQHDDVRFRSDLLARTLKALVVGEDRVALASVLFQRLPRHELAGDLGGRLLRAVDPLELLGLLLRVDEARPKPFNLRRVESMAAPIGAHVRGPVRIELIRFAASAPESTQARPLLAEVVAAVARRASERALIAAFSALDGPTLALALDLAERTPGFPYGALVALARAFAEHADPDVRAWVASTPYAPTGPASLVTAAMRQVAEVLPGSVGRVAAARAVSSAAHSDLDHAVRTWFGEPAPGLADALLARGLPRESSVEAAVALLVSPDPPLAVALAFERFTRAEPTTLAALTAIDQVMVARYQGRRDLPILGNAWLHRWDAHSEAFERQALELPGGLARILEFALELPSGRLATEVFLATSGVLGRWRFRAAARLAEHMDDAALDGIVAVVTGAHPALTPPRPGPGEALPGPWQARDELRVAAAAMLRTLHRAGAMVAELAARRARVTSVLADLPQAARLALRDWIDSAGVGSAAAVPVEATPADAGMQARIQSSDDPEALARWCGAREMWVACAAVERAIALGEVGLGAVVEALAQVPGPPWAAALCATLGRWPEGAALDGVRALARGEDATPEVRYRAAAALAALAAMVGADGPGLGGAMVAAAASPGPPGWFTPADREHLDTIGWTHEALSVALAPSPHFAAYHGAVEWLLEQEPLGERHRLALGAFLGEGGDRRTHLRLRAARALADAGDGAGFCVLLASWLEPRSRARDRELVAGLLAGPGASLRDVVSAARAAMAIGGKAPDRLVEELEVPGVDPEARQEALFEVVRSSGDEALQATALSRIRPGRSRVRKLQQLADLFAWGVRRGRELTGRAFTIQMIGGSALGYTRLETSSIYVNPLPMLRGEPGGRAIVEGLILHELGHHVYDSDAAGLAAWRTATAEGIHSLLNLVLDEHLERNLRARDAEYGDRLKKLSAWAFRHSNNEIAAEDLVWQLGAHAFDALTGTRLRAARTRGSVRVELGALFQAMEAAGQSFARFMRALRMGLGDRYGDPKVAQGLKLFGRGFRALDHEALLERARRLREIFGDQVGILDAVGIHTTADGTPSELTEHREGISDGAVQREVERVLNPRKRKQGDGPRVGPPGRLQINVSAEESFEEIHHVVPLVADEAAHREYARRVRRWSLKMREHFERLGVGHAAERMRVSGHRLDRTRLVAAAVRGDPRLLQSRRAFSRTDLFVGALIDCSGSMDIGDRLERAKHFAVLLAEATRGVPGVDARFFGFTDDTIFDAGSSDRCAVHALETAGGNNDAAALAHGARVALGSRRSARLLVMISDGLPTECSAESLKALARQLGRRHRILCAQVALAPIEEQCFEDYVLLDEGGADGDMGRAVRRFGLVVGELVARALGGG